MKFTLSPPWLLSPLEARTVFKAPLVLAPVCVSICHLKRFRLMKRRLWRGDAGHSRPTRTYPRVFSTLSFNQPGSGITSNRKTRMRPYAGFFADCQTVYRAYAPEGTTLTTGRDGRLQNTPKSNWSRPSRPVATVPLGTERKPIGKNVRSP